MMDLLRVLVSRSLAFLGRGRFEPDLDDELGAHIDLATQENIRKGMGRQAARTAALRAFGGLTQAREAYRMQRGFPLPGQIGHDLHYAFRQLRKSPGFAFTAILTLALGIGVNTAIFSFVDGILLRSLPVTDPASLYRLGNNTDCCYYTGFQNDNGEFSLFPYDAYRFLERSAPEFEHLTAVQSGVNTFSLRSSSQPAMPLHGEYVAGNYFATLGVSVYAGRTFNDQDDQPGAWPVLVVSYPAWQTRFGANPSLVGSTVYVQTHPFTVIGIAPSGFFGDRIAPRPPDFWVPLSSERVIAGQSSTLTASGDDTAWLDLLGRVRPGTGIAALQSRLSGALRQWLMTRPGYAGNGGAALIPRQHIVLSPGGRGIQYLQTQSRAGLRLLMILSSIVLVIACANIANLLLARAAMRRSDIALRMAMGAWRSRLVRQILTESILLSCLGGVAGLAVAYASTRMILLLAFPNAVNMPLHASPSLPVIAFAFGVALSTGIVFGTAPAWLATHAQPAEALRGLSRSSRDRSSFPQQSLIVFQVALSVVLLAGAVLLTQSLVKLEHQDLGVSTANRYVLEIDPQSAGYTVNRLEALYRQIEERFSALPGMAHVALAMYSPLTGDIWAQCVVPEGHRTPGPNERCGSSWDRVSNGFLASLNVPLIKGRGFTGQDTPTSTPVAVVNQAFVKRFFPGQDPIGKHFGIDDARYSGAFEIVGVFADFRMSSPREEPRPLFLRPLQQQYTGFKEPSEASGEESSMFINCILLNFAQPEPDAESLLRKALADIDPNLTIFRATSFEDQVAFNFNQDRLMARLTSLFGILALLLGSVGLYGVTSYYVARRTSEVGIRMALGARRSSVVGMVLRTVLVQVVLGLAIGIPAAFAAGHWMQNLLYGVSGYDPLALLAATIALGTCALIAGWLPARRASAIDPMQALRTE
jgi:macrolide transport system ATP-binding/permease protein